MHHPDADEAIAEMDRIRERARELAVEWVVDRFPEVWVWCSEKAALEEVAK